jgi:SPP1 gp7 family putative phage head morphogenesis protein
VTVSYPKGTEKALAQRMVSRLTVARRLLRARLGGALGRPGVTAHEVAEAIETARREIDRLMAPTLAPLLQVALGVQIRTTQGVADALSRATGADLSADPRLHRARILLELRRVEWAQTVLAWQRRMERDLFEALHRKAATALRAGKPEQVLQILREEVGKTEGRLRLLARNEIGNLVGEITKRQSEALGASSYRWVSERDEHVRPTHRALDGTLRSWAEPHPREGYPGQAVGCRCVAQPLLTPQVGDEAKVYAR